MCAHIGRAFLTNESCQVRAGQHALEKKRLELKKQKKEALDLEEQMVELVEGGWQETVANKKSLELLEQEIAKRASELDCPVRISTCEPPIYSCCAQHLVCSECRPKLTSCGECRGKYKEMGRHRYA